jgi:hypothetical protein
MLDEKISLFFAVLQQQSLKMQNVLLYQSGVAAKLRKRPVKKEICLNISPGIFPI